MLGKISNTARRLIGRLIAPSNNYRPINGVSDIHNEKAIARRGVQIKILMMIIFTISVGAITSTWHVKRRWNIVSTAKSWKAYEPMGTFYRDSYPLRTMIHFWEIAEKEIAELSLDTCDGILSRPLIEGYKRSEIDFCVPKEGDKLSSSISCTPTQYDEQNAWWPHPKSPCISTNIRPIPNTINPPQYNAIGCNYTIDGAALKEHMADQEYIGSRLTLSGREVLENNDCVEEYDRTFLEVIRQDQWNPFHVSEDLITTMVTGLIAGQVRPDLIDSKVQLVFGDGYGMDGNHYTALWDRVGAWAPRRLSLDPWTEKTCVSTMVHSINAGASLLSAMEVNHEFDCASTITWGASHYYRHLMGIPPPTNANPEIIPPLNILFLSRAKYDAWAQKHDSWNTWKAWRHIDNEEELLDRFRRGLSEFCEEQGSEYCLYEDTVEKGTSNWHEPTIASSISDSSNSWRRDDNENENQKGKGKHKQKNQGRKGPRTIRFGTIDPSVHAIENQIYLVGHTTILLSVHSGALGLELFLPPGRGHVIEIQAPAVVGWHHYDIMSSELGHYYEMVRVWGNVVDVDNIWEALERALKREWEKDESKGPVSGEGLGGGEETLDYRRE